MVDVVVKRIMLELLLIMQLLLIMGMFIIHSSFETLGKDIDASKVRVLFMVESHSFLNASMLMMNHTC